MSTSKAQDRAVTMSKAWGDHVSATARATLIINGGAATAVLAFVTRSESGISLKIAGLSLIIYALGVASGTVTLWAVTQLSGWYSSYWEAVADRYD